MKLIRFGSKGAELVDGFRKGCSAYCEDWNGLVLGENGQVRLRAMAKMLAAQPDISQNTRFGSCIARLWKSICVRLNYSDHAHESGMPAPKEPVTFMNASNTVISPFDDLRIPRASRKTDWEVELGVGIGNECSYLGSEAEARAAIAGYCVSHDVSEREFQLEWGGQWAKGKSCDMFNPLPTWSRLMERRIRNNSTHG